jgi:hypothetical protein
MQASERQLYLLRISIIQSLQGAVFAFLFSLLNYLFKGQKSVIRERMTIKNEPKMIDRFFASSDLENSNPEGSLALQYS